MYFFFSALFSFILGRMYIAKCHSLAVGHTVRVYDVKLLFQNYDKAKNIPSMGGLFINFTILLMACFFLKMTSLLAICLLVLLSYSLLGLYDDLGKKEKKELKARTKFLMQVLLACITVYALSFILPNTDKLYIPFVKETITIPLFISYPLMVFTIVAASNSVNLSDGLDALAGGCSLFVFSAFIIFLWVLHPHFASMQEFLYVCVGALLGFLALNRYPAKVFMGDVGSLSLGALMAVIAIILRAEFYLAFVGLVFVLESVSVILQVASFRICKKRIFLCAPFHHHFQLKGASEKEVVFYFHLTSFILFLFASRWLLCTYV